MTSLRQYYADQEQIRYLTERYAAKLEDERKALELATELLGALRAGGTQMIDVSAALKVLIQRNLKRAAEEYRDCGPNSMCEKLDHIAGKYIDALRDGK